MVRASGLGKNSLPVVCPSGECNVKLAPKTLQYGMSIDILPCAPRFVTEMNAPRDESCFCMVSPILCIQRLYAHAERFSAFEARVLIIANLQKTEDTWHVGHLLVSLNPRKLTPKLCQPSTGRDKSLTFCLGFSLGDECAAYDLFSAATSGEPRATYLRRRKAFSTGPIKSAASQLSPLASLSKASNVG